MPFKNYLIIASLTFACAQSALAMRCNAIKAFTFARKTNQLKASSFCTKPTSSNDASSDLKQLQEIYDASRIMNPNCFNVITKNAPCAHLDSCCRLAKEDEAQAQKGKKERLRKNPDQRTYMPILITAKLLLEHIEEYNKDAQTIFLNSKNKEMIAPFFTYLSDFLINITECLVHTVNIHGGCSREELILALSQERRLHELAAANHEAARRGESWKLLDISTVSIPIDGYTPEERQQAECNEIYKRIMKSHGRKINKNILLGWQKRHINPSYTMHPSEVIKFSRAMANLQENNQ